MQKPIITGFEGHKVFFKTTKRFSRAQRRTVEDFIGLIEIYEFIDSQGIKCRYPSYLEKSITFETEEDALTVYLKFNHEKP